MDQIQGNARQRIASHPSGHAGAPNSTNGMPISSSSQFHHFAVPTSTSAAYSKEGELRKILEPLASQLSQLERRLGRLEQPSYESTSPSPNYNRYTASRAASSPLPPESPRGGGQFFGTAPHADARNQLGHYPSSYIESPRTRNNVLSALGQSEDLIMKLIEENHRLRRRLDLALSEIHRLRSEAPATDSKRRKLRNGQASASSSSYTLASDTSSDEETTERDSFPLPLHPTVPHQHHSLHASSGRPGRQLQLHQPFSQNSLRTQQAPLSQEPSDDKMMDARPAMMAVSYPEGYEPSKRRFSVSSESYNPDLLREQPMRARPKTEEQMRRLVATVQENVLFHHLETKRIQDVVNAMWEVDHAPGDIVIRQGDDGDNMYVIEDGEFEVLYSGEVVGLLKSGKAFGETALMYNCPRTATIRCKTPSKLWAIDRETFRRIIMTESIKRRALYQDFLSKVPLLENLLDYERAKVADALEPIIFKDGDVIIRQGSTDLDGFYIIEEGTVRCTKGPDPLPEGAPAPGAEVEAIRLGPGDYFGELALLTNKPRAATVSSVGTTKCLRITKKHFDQVMGPCEQVLMRNMRTYTSYVDLQKGTKQQRAMSQHKVSSNGSPQDQSDVDQSANPSSSHPEGQDDESTTTEGQARSSNAMDEDSVVPSPAPSAGQTVSLRRQSARNADRQEIVMRAIVSEEEYVAILRKIVGGYLVGMLHTPELKVSPQDIEIIFANAEELCQIHSNFLEALKRASVDSIQLLQVMKSLISQLHHYLPFIQCFYSSILIRRKRKSVPSFSSFLKTIRENDKEDLDGLLDHPFRRVNHYAQLVLDLYQTASQDNSKEAFHVLIQEVRSILASLEEARVRAEQVYGILRNITGEVEFAQNPSREFVHEGRLAITSDKTSNLVYAFLFNDILVCATQIETGMGKPKLAHYITVPLSSCVYRSTTTHFTLEWGKGESGAKEGISFARDQIWESHLLRVLSGLHPGNPSEAAQ